MSIVSVEELRDYMSGIGLSTEQMQAAQNVLDGVQAELETYINRPLTPKLVQERIMADQSGMLPLTITPVHRLISIKDVWGNEVPIHQNMGTDATEPAVPALLEDEYEQYEDSYGADGQVDYIGDTFYSSTVLGYGGFGSPVTYPTLWPNTWYVAKYIGGYIGYTDADLKLSIMRVAAREVAENHDDSVSIRGGVVSPAQIIPGVESKYGWTQGELAMHDRKKRRLIV